MGYLPDSFGHTAQLPQILRGFGIEAAVFWRGVGDEPGHTEFRWRAPDGSTVLLCTCPRATATQPTCPSNERP